ncbi:hypothetical protein [Marinoscillum pacificum]|uniref:hypothetical protein n=1 Tax=Marinoscillum pacificum TaxID=392723 RepID=UPI002157C033|nr:hypothetical protein [Marinoscillum pacificum]
MFWNTSKSPITAEDEEWIKACFHWFEETFHVNLREVEPYAPTKSFIGFDYHGKEDEVLKLVDLVADKMNVQQNSSIQVYFYEEFQPMEFTDEGVLSHYEENSQLTNGRYSKLVDGVYEVGIERTLIKNPIALIATIAHEVAHIKLLGEGIIEENDEPLTDLVASLFGFAVFLANSSLIKMTTWSGNTHTGWKMGGGAGYLHHKLYTFLLGYWLHHQEKTSSDWFDWLEKEIQTDIKKTLKYLNKK